MKFVAAAAASALMALAACSDGAGERTVTLDVRHSKFSVSEVQVRPGETVRFVVRNTDPIAHELIIGDESLHDAHQSGAEVVHDDRPGEVSVAPGETAVTTYRFGPTGGRLLFGCHLPGHWSYGMRGEILVV